MALLSSIFGIAETVIDRVIPDQTERDRLKNELRAEVLRNESSLVEAQGRVIQTEARSESWLTRTWRPIAMLSFLSIILWRWFIGPLVSGIFGIPIELLIPPASPEVEQQFFTLITFGLTGYVVGRSGEQIARAVLSNRGDDTIIDHVTGRRSGSQNAE